MTITDVASVVLDSMMDFELRTGVKPRRVYLGEQEYAAIGVGYHILFLGLDVVKTDQLSGIRITDEQPLRLGDLLR